MEQKCMYFAKVRKKGSRLPFTTTEIYTTSFGKAEKYFEDEGFEIEGVIYKKYK